MQKMDATRTIGKLMPGSQNRMQLILDRWICVLVVFGSLLLIGCNLASDAKLKKVFEGNRDDFDKLLNMSKQDTRVVRIRFDSTALDNDDSWPRKDVGFSEQRWDEYRLFFRKLGMKEGIGHRNDVPSALFLYAECTGSAIDRDCKGYVYSEMPLTPVKNNLDRLAPGLAFEPLSRNWYLFRDGG
jgi:hypothetical protein